MGCSSLTELINEDNVEVGCSSLTEFINEDNFIKNGPLTAEIGYGVPSFTEFINADSFITNSPLATEMGGFTRTVSLRMVCWLQGSQVRGVGGGFNLTEAHVTAVGPQRSEV